MQSSQTYTFAPIPLNYISDVVLQNSPQLISPDYANIAIYSNTKDDENYEVIVVLQGGIEQLQQVFTKDDVAKAVQKIRSQRYVYDPPYVPLDLGNGNTTNQTHVVK